jgi:sphingolipid delta-4 desaturase
MSKSRDFIYSEGPNYHIQRRRDILKKYPQVKELTGNYPLSALYILMLVSTQLCCAFILRDFSWPVVIIVSYIFGAFISHALYVMIHECTHNLVFKGTLANRIMGLICDIPLFVPSAMGFRQYHMIHHKHLGEYSYDPDITSRFEGNMIGNGPLKKSLWLMFFFLSQGLRPLKVKHYQPLNFWSALNVVLIFAINLAIYFYFGPKALAYLALSTTFGLGLHPLGGRWIQEHFITKEGQETYSYYGILNKLTFNMGFHNEHHDLMNIPWVNLPKLKKLAPEYYDTLKSYNSWTKVLLNFIFDPKLDSFSRIVHEDNHPPSASSKSMPNTLQREI